MNEFVPTQPAKSHRIVLDLLVRQKRLDTVLLEALKNQESGAKYQLVTRTQFKDLFKEGRITIKGQRAGPSSALAKGVTYIDILERSVQPR
jgi:hypothetical protein